MIGKKVDKSTFQRKKKTYVKQRSYTATQLGSPIFSAIVTLWDMIFLLQVGLGVYRLNLIRTQFLKKVDILSSCISLFT